MPAEAKRVETGIYLMFMADNASGDEIADTVQRYQRAAEAEGVVQRYIVIIEEIGVTNPLHAARQIAACAEPYPAHILIAGNARASHVITERLSALLPATPIERFDHQTAAIDRAKQLLGTGHIPVAISCDYL